MYELPEDADLSCITFKEQYLIKKFRNLTEAQQQDICNLAADLIIENNQQLPALHRRYINCF